MPSDELSVLSDSSFSFTDIGTRGSENMAVALFSFLDMKSYESYKKSVVNDKQCIEITAFFNTSKCFLSYERNFLKPIFPVSDYRE